MQNLFLKMSLVQPSFGCQTSRDLVVPGNENLEQTLRLDTSCVTKLKA